MSFADCTACRRRHKRPCNSRCEYAKSAVEHCVQLGLSSAEYVKYLPELLEEDIEVAGNKTKASPRPQLPDTLEVHSHQSVVESSLLTEFISESIRSRKLFESSQAQVERMMAQLLDLKVSATKPKMATFPAVGSPSVATQPEPTGSLNPPLLHTSTPIGSSVPGAQWTSLPPGLFPPATGVSWSHLPQGTVTSTMIPTTTASSWMAAQGQSGPSPGSAAAAAAAAAAATLSPPVTPPGLPAGHGPVPLPSAPYLPPYLLPGASQQATAQVPYRCEVDHQHLPKHSCSTGKRKLTVFDLEVHMRYTSSSTVTMDDIIASSLSLLESMMRQGVDCTGYVKHIRFLVEKSKVYQQAALIGYDTEMRERAEAFGAGVFCYGDHDLSHRWLGYESLKSVSLTQSSNSQSSTKKKSNRSSKFGSCWAWNEGKSCKASPCKYKHTCSNCSADHKAADCPSKSGSQVKSSK